MLKKSTGILFSHWENRISGAPIGAVMVPCSTVFSLFPLGTKV